MPAFALTPATAALLTIPPLLWAGNAVAGRMLAPLVPPITLNLLRWVLVALLLLPLGWRLWSLRHQALASLRPLLLMGLLGIGCYNALQYMALRSSSPINITLVAASSPIWMMLVGALFFAERPSWRQGLATLFSLAGVLLVLTRGSWQQLAALSLVPGDLLMLLAALCWAGYSWLLLRAPVASALRSDWAAFLLVQVLLGIGWCALAAGLEWSSGAQPIRWGLPLAAGLLFIALGPGLIAYRCWGMGVQRAGPTLAALFSNLTPLFAALMSALLLGEAPQPYHAAAFALIVTGIVISARR
ncbi:EamA family transporter [Vandammella animalimorsus]|uniref:EamA family transporter n=1 Tax=Vandammella animalimorsus TaxID=2029117 RepID=A0A2A2T4B6_9BURK|nr:DMT family transporter [Vandammella animalimorsus]PAT31414.1 EamA family transporter [Vandammella animalimorsus]PAX16406.1 EamA family transporter [Vandammella animalimorsus]PAX18821.1 EamA family transporter [Vandammella animalimorsus]